MFNQYAQYPSIPGLVQGRDEYNNHLITMATDNIQARIKQVDQDNKRGKITHTPNGWSPGRAKVLGSANKIVWSYTEMPNTDRKTLLGLADTIDAESVSKKVDNEIKGKI